MAKKVKTHTFNKVNYDIEFSERLDGLCDYPRSTKPSIRIMAKPYTKNELITIIHESLHASDWSKSEEIVDRVSTDIGRLLWRLGYRREK